MAARFPTGMSVASTRKISNTIHNPPEPHAKNHVLRGNNTASGMPGYINAHQTEAMDGAKGGRAGSAGPRYTVGDSMHSTRSLSQSSRTSGAIGKRGPVSPHGHGGFGPVSNKKGTQTKSYRADSTGPAGAIKSNEHDGSRHVHTHNVSHHKGHPGRMEKLIGRAKMSTER